ncbi:hypothetical protein PYW08_000252 [Mythimna loreyi]|uniref:Uncharacterized protein n=1 Tax=Mythimna loreyi TaxID=667449 RepID=A0ACC2RBP5_9NEOP|nr:hypothetical protein PYW08_000252 [Mythimna loreyi]
MTGITRGGRFTEIKQRMICKRCQRSLRSGEGLKCGICDSCFHMRCINDPMKDHRDGGDRGYQWKCSLCQNYVSTGTSGSDIIKEKDKEKSSLMQAVNAISEKFELVNKIQLPKLNSDLAQIKTVADRIVQQNNDILRKIDEIEGKRKIDKECLSSTSRYRRRNVSLIPKSTSTLEKKEEPPLALNDKNLRYRPRRRSYLLNRIFIILNRKMNRTQSPRR